MGNQVYGSNTKKDNLTLAEARQYVSDEEFERLRRAFIRFKKNGLTFDDFRYHVLGGARIPLSAARLLFSYFTKGNESLSFENLVCALVGICRVEVVQASFAEENPDFVSWGLLPPMLTAPIHDAFISFYEVMSYVTHLSVEEVRELEKVFATISDRGQCTITKKNWNMAAAECFPDWLVSGLFKVFDENGNGSIDFRELVCGVSAMCRGPSPSRFSFLAKLWDEDMDGVLSPEELIILYERLAVPSSKRTISCSRGENAAPVDFAAWAISEGSEFVDELADMALEIGHICLGLRPEMLEVEHQVISNLLERVRDYSIAEWNIVSSHWYAEWSKTILSGTRPPPVSNRDICGTKEDGATSSMVACITAESACLRSNINPSEFIKVPPVMWRALLRWHGSQQSIDGQFTRRLLPAELSDTGNPQLELFPLDVIIMRHERRKSAIGRDEIGQSPWAYAQVSRAVSIGELLQLAKQELRLNDEEARLWLVTKKDEREQRRESKEGIRLSDMSSKEGRQGTGTSSENVLLDEHECSLHELGSLTGKELKLLLEIRDRTTGIWPEEARIAATGSGSIGTACGEREGSRPGFVGLVNTGNYCYRNAAVQCLARVSPLTEYLLDAGNITTLNKRESNVSVKTTLEYSMLLKEMWTTTRKNISPIDFNEALKNAQSFMPGEQHDCQEFVNFMLENIATALTEQLKVQSKQEDEEEKNKVLENVVEKPKISERQKATEAWLHFIEHNNSLVSKLFAGQLKSSLVCKSCGASSSVFEPFTSLSLPIGFDNAELFQVIVVRRDGSVPTRYGFRLPREANIRAFKESISEVCSITPTRIAMLCMSNKGNLMQCAAVSDNASVTTFPSGARVYAMELPEIEEKHAWTVAVHRKLQYNYEPYFLGATSGFIVNVFGLPLIVPRSETLNGSSMYADVWRQMSRFISAQPLPFSSRAADPCEDSSSGHPFTLSIVDSSLQWCALCPPLKFCRGCQIRADATIPMIPQEACIAVDWMPTALYLRYNLSEERKFDDDASVEQTWQRHYSPSSLEACLEKFSCPETLDSLIECEHCQQRTRRDKVMTIWTLPRYLIIQLKRFEYRREEGRIGKCKRAVDFPLTGFDPTPFVDSARESTEGRAALYDCIAISTHYGQLESGHFVAYARTEDGHWLLFNDCTVKDVLSDEVDRSNAYLLFYERKGA
ncbi:unnamed protein product, partial [Mesorhabditis belari]|uniref:ubiquitinyl hydrolase 1 n=1 Tax=Mesorhabditis belari TaxID=2138241 RepID=A0AAF3EB92_9BILA